jgi:hypothetical protein
MKITCENSTQAWMATLGGAYRCKVLLLVRSLWLQQDQPLP